MTTADDIPAAIRQFISERIDSVELLRVLLLLQDDPSRKWTVDEITRELRSSASSVKKRVEDLYSRKILSRLTETPHLHQYRPTSPELGKTIEALAEFYKQRQYSVIEFIYSRPADTLRALADAFLIKKDKS